MRPSVLSVGPCIPSAFLLEGLGIYLWSPPGGGGGSQEESVWAGFQKTWRVGNGGFLSTITAGWLLVSAPDGGYLQLGLPWFLLTAWTQMRAQETLAPSTGGSGD